MPPGLSAWVGAGAMGEHTGSADAQNPASAERGLVGSSGQNWWPQPRKEPSESRNRPGPHPSSAASFIPAPVVDRELLAATQPPLALPS